MITAVHTLVYADDPDAARAFFRDVLQLPGVDTGGGWLIFRTGPSELGVHPSTWDHGGESGGAQSGGTEQRFDLSHRCIARPHKGDGGSRCDNENCGHGDNSCLGAPWLGVR